MAPRSVLITGCSSGIGLATAVLLAKAKQHSFNVYATMRSLKSAGALEMAAGDTLDKSLFIRELDVTKAETIAPVVDEMLGENGRIDVLVNNAGIFGIEYLDDRSMEWCHSVMDANYWGVVRTIRAVLPAMKKQQSGRIINVTSIYGLLGAPFGPSYSASKFAVEGFSESCAPVLRDGYNIRLSIVQPGPVETAVSGKMEADMRANPGAADPVKDRLFQLDSEIQSQMGDFIQQPEELARLIMDVILSESPHLRYQSSEAVTKMAASKLIDPTSDGFLDVLKK